MKSIKISSIVGFPDPVFLILCFPLPVLAGWLWWFGGGQRPRVLLPKRLPMAA